MTLNRNMSSILNAFSAILLTLVNGLLGIIATRMIIIEYGSDFNGINSTANQIINVLLIMEGGFTLASNVALFKPLTEKKYQQMNNILAVTRGKFRLIGMLFFFTGIVISIAYTFSIKSELPSELIFTVILMTLAPAAFNLYYTTTYRVLLQTDQKEYVINLITAITLGAGHILNIILVLMNGSIWLVRFFTMICAVLNCFFINYYVKRRYKFLKLGKVTEPVVIKGTGDVMAQKVTGAIYTSAPMVFLSIFSPGGAVLASVYAVYNNVFNMIKSLLRSIIDAPRHGIGQLLANEEKEVVWKIYYQYEYISICAMFVTIVTSYVLIMPFISIYTSGISDANYFDQVIALLMIAISVLELIHIPSGHLMNMAGEFRAGKNFQIISCVVLVIFMPIGIKMYGVYGLLFSVLIVAILLAILEVWFVHEKFFSNKLCMFIKMIIPFLIIGIISGIIEKNIFSNIEGFVMFLLSGVFLFILNIVIVILTSSFFCKSELNKTIMRIKTLVKKG